MPRDSLRGGSVPRFIYRYLYLCSCSYTPIHSLINTAMYILKHPMADIQRIGLLRQYQSVICSVGVGYPDVNQPIVFRSMRFRKRHIRNQLINENWKDKPLLDGNAPVFRRELFTRTFPPLLLLFP